MGKFLDYLKNEASFLFRNKKNLAGLLILAIMVLALPLGLKLIRQQQILKSRATDVEIVFVTGPNLIVNADGTFATKIATVSLLLTSQLGQPTGSTVTIRSENPKLSFLPKGLVGIVSAAECSYPSSQVCPNMGQCSNGNVCAAGHKYCVWAADGNNTWGSCVNDGGNSCGEPGCQTGTTGSTSGTGGTSCTPGAYLKPGDCTGNCSLTCASNAGEAYIDQCKADGSGYDRKGSECRTECPNNCGGSTTTIITPVASDVGNPGGCCSGSGQGTCRSWERCDIANGSCGTGANGFSCRSAYPTSNCAAGVLAKSPCCARDTDCGGTQFNMYCKGGVCATGSPPAGNCQSAITLEAKFSINGSLQSSATIAPGQKITASVFRNGTGEFAGSSVNGDYTPTDVSASLTGPNGFNKSINMASGSDFTLTTPGVYTLNASCGAITGKATLTVTGTSSCPLPSSSISDSCVSCIKSQPGRSTLTDDIKKIGSDNGQSWGSCTDSQLVSQWCSAIDTSSCNSYETGACLASCGGVVTPSAPPGSSASPAPEVPAITISKYRVADNPNFTGAGTDWKDYTTAPMPASVTFQDPTTPGPRTIFVEFQDSNGKIGCKDYGDNQPCSKSITLLGPDPSITGCNLTFEGDTTVVTLTGANFGTTQGSGGVKSDSTSLSVRSWKADSVQVTWPNAPTNQSLPVTLTTSLNQVSPVAQCSSISQLALGAQIFCRGPSQTSAENVDLILAGDFAGGTKTTQKVTIDSNGVVQGLTQKLQEGKNYNLSLEAPHTTRKTVSFTAQNGTTNVPNFTLPVGDIFPAVGGDGAINSFDHDELVREWIVSTDATGRFGDFNQDSRVNSIDWACMRFDFNATDNAEPAVGTATTAPSPSTTTSPTSSPTPAVPLVPPFLVQSFLKTDGHNTSYRFCPMDATTGAVTFGSCTYGDYDLATDAHFGNGALWSSYDSWTYLNNNVPTLVQSFLKTDGHSTSYRFCPMDATTGVVSYGSCTYGNYDLATDAHFGNGALWSSYDSWVYLNNNVPTLVQSFLKTDGHNTSYRFCPMDATTGAINYGACTYGDYDLATDAHFGNGNLWRSYDSYVYLNNNIPYLTQSFLKTDGHNTTYRICPMDATTGAINYGSCTYGDYDLATDAHFGNGALWSSYDSWTANKGSKN